MFKNLKKLFCKHNWVTERSDSVFYHRCLNCQAILEGFPDRQYKKEFDKFYKDKLKRGLNV